MRIEQLAAVPDRDRAPLLDFWIAAWAPVVPSMDVGADRDWLSDHLDRLLHEGAVLLLMRDGGGVPRGFLTVHRDMGTVDQRAVDPACGGQGLGCRLMEAATGLSRVGFVVTGEAVSERSGLPVFTMAWPGGVP